MKNVRTYAGMLTAMTLMSLTFIWFKLANTLLHPFMIVFIRLCVASVFLIGLAMLTGNLQQIRRKDLKYFILLTFFTPFGYFFFEGLGLARVQASVGAILISTIPLFMPVGGRFLLGERLSVFNLLGILVSFTGVMLVIIGKGFRPTADPLGILMLMIAVFMAVGYTLLLKKMSYRYNAFTLTVWQNILGIAFFLPLIFIIGEDQLQTLISHPSLWMPLLYLGILGSAISFIFFNQGIRILGATRAESFTYLIPVLTAIFAFFLLDEPLGLKKVSGIFVVLAGVLLTQLRTRRRSLDPPTIVRGH